MDHQFPGMEFFKPQRFRLAEAMAEEYAGREFIANTFPYESTAQLRFDVVDFDATPAPGTAFAVARRGQVLEWFNYGIGDNIPNGLATKRATQADTNVSQGGRTNGASDFVIEGMSCWLRSTRPLFTGANNPLASATGAPVDPDVILALSGQAPVYDPATIVVPAQFDSPFNLEAGVFQRIIDSMDLEISWDRQRIEPIGALSLLPQGRGGSYLRSNGVPASGNVFAIDEGYLWRKDGEPDSELVIRATLREPVAVPLSAITWRDDAGTAIWPDQVFLQIGLGLHGVALKLPSRN